MPVIDPTKYEKFKPLICEAIREVCEPEDDWRSDVSNLLAILREEGLTDEAEAAMVPYVSLFLEQVRQGLLDPFSDTSKLQGLTEEPTGVFVQPDLFDGHQTVQDGSERALIDQLIAATKLYDSSEAIQELFAFTVRLREFAPFNAMLLHIQKPGLTHAATAHDWWQRFGRVPKKGTRPLLVLRMKGPVDFVFDVQDTEGKDLPADAFSFPTFGDLSDHRFAEFMRAVSKEKIDLVELDAGDAHAGWIRLLARSRSDKGKNVYQLGFNKNHGAPTRFVTVAHELAHLYLGHLGADNGRRVPDRRDTPHDLMEVEAEMAAYLVAMRNGLEPRSESYLSNYKGGFEELNLYAVTRTANAVETAMGISAQKLWNEKV